MGLQLTFLGLGWVRSDTRPLSPPQNQCKPLPLGTLSAGPINRWRPTGSPTRSTNADPTATNYDASTKTEAACLSAVTRWMARQSKVGPKNLLGSWMVRAKAVFYGLSFVAFITVLSIFEPLPRSEVCRHLYEGHPDCPRVAP